MESGHIGDPSSAPSPGPDPWKEVDGQAASVCRLRGADSSDRHPMSSSSSRKKSASCSTGHDVATAPRFASVMVIVGMRLHMLLMTATCLLISND